MMRYFDNKDELLFFISDVDGSVLEQFNEEITSGAYSDNIRQLLNDAQKDLQLAA